MDKFCIVEGFAYSKETGKKFCGMVKLSKEVISIIRPELLKEEFSFSEGENKLPVNIIIRPYDEKVNLSENKDFSKYVESLTKSMIAA